MKKGDAKMTMTIERIREKKQKQQQRIIDQQEQFQLEQDLRECIRQMQKNQTLFDLETEPELIDQRIYEYQALRCRYGYLQRQARAVGLRTIL